MARALFKADRNQIIAVVVMIAAVFTFAVGEILIGGILFVVAAIFSIGGLFWNAHTQDVQDRIDAAEAAKGKAAGSSNQQESK